MTVLAERLMRRGLLLLRHDAPERAEMIRQLTRAADAGYVNAMYDIRMLLSLAAGIWVKSLTGSSGEAAFVSVRLRPVPGRSARRAGGRPGSAAAVAARAQPSLRRTILPLLAVTGRDRIWIIFAVLTWYGVHLVLSGPAEEALFAVMLPLDLRRKLNGWNLGLQETGRLIAPLIGAGLFALPA